MADGRREGSADEGRTEEASTTKIEKMYSRLVCDDCTAARFKKDLVNAQTVQMYRWYLVL